MLTNITFTKEEQNVLDLGLQHNIGILDEHNHRNRKRHKTTGPKTPQRIRYHGVEKTDKFTMQTTTCKQNTKDATTYLTK